MLSFFCFIEQSKIMTYIDTWHYGSKKIRDERLNIAVFTIDADVFQTIKTMLHMFSPQCVSLDKFNDKITIIIVQYCCLENIISWYIILLFLYIKIFLWINTFMLLNELLLYLYIAKPLFTSSSTIVSYMDLLRTF